MSKIKKTIVGTMLGFCMLANCVIPCYAATSTITADISATKVYGKFIHSEQGHQIKVTVYYKEKNNTSGAITMDSVSNVKNGSETTVIASRSNTAGHQFIWGQAFGYVDGEVVAASSEVSL